MTEVAVQFADELQEYAESLGVELYGVASAQMYVERFPDKPAPSRFVEDARSVIVMGMPFEPGTVATVLNPDLAGPERRDGRGYQNRAILIDHALSPSQVVDLTSLLDASVWVGRLCS